MASGGNSTTVISITNDNVEQEKYTGRKLASSLDLLAKINDEFLTCQICFETYTSPKSLSCQHTFCKKCLQDYLTPNASALLCPTCRCSQTLTSDGIQGLKDNFFISSMADMLKTVKEIRNDDKQGTSLLCDTCDDDCRKSAISRCLDCTDFLCTDCSIWHRRTKLTRRHKIVSLSELESGIHNEELKSRAKIYCTIHEGEAAKIYCQTCKCAICHDCVDSDHAGHDRCMLKDEVHNQSGQIEKLLTSGKSKTEVLQDMQKSIQEIAEMKQRSLEKAEWKIIKTCGTLVAEIERQKDDLIKKIRAMHDLDVKKLQADTESVDLQMNSLSSCAEFSRKVLEYGTPKEVLGLNNQMTQILQQLLETHPAIKYHKEQDTMALDYKFNIENLKLLDNIFGKIEFVPKPFTGPVIKVLRAVDAFCVGEQVVASPVGEQFMRMDSVETTKLLKQIGKQGEEDGEFESTPNIAVNSVGEVMTSDTDSCKIQIFDPHGDFKDSFKTKINGKILRPSGIAVLRNDDIAVCCEDQVYIWTHEGKPVLGFGKGIFVNCNSIATDDKNRIIVSDISQRMITIFRSDGTLIGKFGAGAGVNDKKFVEPRYVACDSQNNIIISDSGDCTIKKFTHKGELVCMFGEEGSEPGQLQGPRGVCVDENDNILVADCWNHRVDLFTPDGVFKKHIVTDVDGLHFPEAVALTAVGKLVLSEDYSWSVKMFSLPEYQVRSPSVSSGKSVTSPTVLIKDLEQLAGKFDMTIF
uniref:tripartite motif-containing protein 3-like n=1 Tax=Styela clava TaxID=7725 RepID=UPI00193A01FF|nr:tripartite motif-containing protein 3-like [Styela clava]